MPKPPPAPADFLVAMDMLGVGYPRIEPHMGLAQANAIIEAWKQDELKKAWRRVVVEHHPDRATDAGDRERRTRLVQAANAAHDLLLGMVVVPKPPPTGPVKMNVVIRWGGMGGTNTVTAGGGTINAWPGSSPTWGRNGPTRGGR